MIADSPALLAREQRALDGYAEALAALLTEESGATGDDLRPHVVARTR